MVLILVAAITAAVLGLRQQRRTRRLARHAHNLQLRFASEDPFDVPRRYAAFGLMRSGHSAQAYNVIHGQRGGATVRAFDFRYEVGHGTRRLTRHYECLVVESPLPLASVVLWHQRDADAAPMESRQIDGAVGDWAYRGPDAQAVQMAQAFAGLAQQDLSIESQPGIVLVCGPVRRGGWSLDRRLDGTLAALESLREQTAPAATP